MPAIGPTVRDYRLGLGTPRRAKAVAICMIVTAGTLSAAFGFHSTMPRLLLAGACAIGPGSQERNPPGPRSRCSRSSHVGVRQRFDVDALRDGRHRRGGAKCQRHATRDEQEHRDRDDAPRPASHGAPSRGPAQVQHRHRRLALQVGHPSGNATG
jgi:hypothetical protein